MKVRRFSLVVGLLPLFAITGARAQDKSSSGCWPWPDSLDGVIASPQNHTVIYEDNNVRVLDVHTPPGTTNSMHDHQWSSIFIYDEAQPKGRDHKSDGTVTAVGGAIPADASFPLLYVSGPQAPHAYENVDTFTKHFYRVEFKKIPFRCPTEIHPVSDGDATHASSAKFASWPWPASMDAVVASPKNHKVLFESDDVRILEVTVLPGTKENMHDHPWPSVFLYDQAQPKGQDASDDGKVTVVGRRLEGADFPVTRRKGPERPHAFENTDTFPLHFYRVEFKKLHTGS